MRSHSPTVSAPRLSRIALCVDCGDDGPLLHRYLTDAPGELPGQWSGRQADLLGPSGNVSTEALERLLSGHDPVSDVVLGLPFTDRTLWPTGK